LCPTSGQRHTNFLPEWVWWYWFGIGGGLAWLAVIFLWHRSGDFGWAAHLVCRSGAGLGWWLGYFLTGFWLATFAFGCVLLVLAAGLLGLGHIISRRRAKRHL
jgi:hypothetical protein